MKGPQGDGEGSAGIPVDRTLSELRASARAASG